MDELKPCPFCGETAEIVVITDSPNKLGRHNKVRCLKCYAQSGIRYYSRDEAIKAWNTCHVDPTRIEVDKKRLREIATELTDIPEPEIVAIGIELGVWLKNSPDV